MPDENRQGFLEPELSLAQEEATIGVVGLSGGGSHIAQQLAHLGFRKFVLYDPKVMELKHIHRLVGGWERDARRRRTKTSIASRTIRLVQPEAEVHAIPRAWIEEPEPLAHCDVVFGAVDSFRGRAELECQCRRFNIPLIDIGMKVTCLRGHPPRMAGQVLLSMPGGPCMKCLGFLREEHLIQEGLAYGDAGPAPQVVWINGLLASAAIGLFVDLVTGKCGTEGPPIYQSFDGNAGTLSAHPNLNHTMSGPCPHYGPEHLGDPRGRTLRGENRFTESGQSRQDAGTWESKPRPPARKDGKYG